MTEIERDDNPGAIYIHQAHTATDLKAATRPKVMIRPQLTTFRNSAAIADVSSNGNVKVETKSPEHISISTSKLEPARPQDMTLQRVGSISKTAAGARLPPHRKHLLAQTDRPKISGTESSQQADITSDPKAAPRLNATGLPEPTECHSSAEIAKVANNINVKAEVGFAKQIDVAPTKVEPAMTLQRKDNLPKTAAAPPFPPHRKYLKAQPNRDNIGAAPMQQANSTVNVKVAPRPKFTTRPQLTTCLNSVQVAKIPRIINVKAEAKLAKQIAAATIEVVKDEETNEPFSISDINLSRWDSKYSTPSKTYLPKHKQLQQYNPNKDRKERTRRFVSEFKERLDVIAKVEAGE